MVSIETYLNTSYDPDLEYVDGVLRDRNVGEWLHSLAQSNIIFALRRKHPDLKVLPALRSNTAATRYRSPDVSVVLQPPATRFLMDAAHIAIEILSEDDKITRVLEKLAEYEAKGVRNIWVIDPRLESMSVYRGGNLIRVADRLTDGEGIELTPDEIFQR